MILPFGSSSERADQIAFLDFPRGQDLALPDLFENVTADQFGNRINFALLTVLSEKAVTS